MNFINLHGHTDASNHNTRDSIIKTDQMVDIAMELGHGGVAITDHAVLSNHVKAIKYLKELRKKGKATDFKLCLGCEIYLVNREEIDKARETNTSTKFYHLVVLAKNKEGYKQLYKLASKGWENEFTFRGFMRTPVYKEDFKCILEENKGNLIVSSACLGSELATYILAFLAAKDNKNTEDAKKYQIRINEYVHFMKDLLGDDYYIELQPNFGEEQIRYNQFALQLADFYGVKAIVTTDAHYHNLETKKTHSDFLKSQNADRETDEFYSSTYMMSTEEINKYLYYLSDEKVKELFDNTIEIGNKIEEFDLHIDTKVPKALIKLDNDWKFKFKSYKCIQENKYPYIKKYMESEYEIDRILMQQIEKGMAKLGEQYDYPQFERINRELESMWCVSEGLKQRLSSYYVLTQEIVNAIWEISLVGVSRGSAGAFYISYLLGICQINPMKYDLPDWRHLDKNKIELADIDIDTESAERPNILELLKEKYGRDRVLTIGTFKTEGVPSAIDTICRGMGIDINVANYIKSMIPREGIAFKTLSYCFEHEKDDDACNRFIKILRETEEEHKGFIENIKRVEGLICGKSSHASGIYIFQDSYFNYNAMMKTSSGLEITQFDMLDSDYQGGLKIDVLTIKALDKMRKCLDLLVEYGEIEYKGSLRKTYDAYIHPDKIDLESKILFEKLRNGDVLDAFQYDSVAGVETISKIRPDTFKELMDGNALMRLNPKDVELPIDVYVRHKNDITKWYKHMEKHGLTEDEMETLKKHLGKSYGVAPTQEDIMMLSMDEKISGFDLVKANKLRKTVAKSYARHMADEIHKLMIEEGVKRGNRKVFVDYVWENFIVPQLKYSFSQPHLCGYTLILMQELNLAVKFPPIYWKVACLNINSGLISDDIVKTTDYGSISKAIGNMPKGFVLPPDINLAAKGFKPYKDKAIFSINAINGIGKDVANNIVNNRPYANFEDFYDKCVTTKLVPLSKVYTLIKAGCFDSINSNRRALMQNYVEKTTKESRSLTLSNIPKLIEFGLIPLELGTEVDLYLLKKEIFKKSNLVKQNSSTNADYVIPDKCVTKILRDHMECFKEILDIDANGKYIINNKLFNKIYESKIGKLKEFISSKELLNSYNMILKGKNWNKNCSGSVLDWEMESICYYTNKHQVECLDLSAFCTIEDFFELPEIPVVLKREKYRNIEFDINKISAICGVVLDKNKNKSIITVTTPSGCVDIKMNKGSFAHYDKVTDISDSWFKRGTILIVIGYRRGEVFYAKKYKDSIFNHTLMKVDIVGDKIELKVKR